MSPPFYAEQIGSFLRPPSLLSLLASHQKHAYSTQISPELQKATDDAIAALVEKQFALNIRPITSGEFNRYIFYSGFFENLTGCEVIDAIPLPDGFRSGLPTITTLQSKGFTRRPGVIAVDKIRYLGNAYLDEWEQLKRFVPEEKWKECKITMPPITWQHLHLKPGTAYKQTAYTNDRDYFIDLAQAYRTEFQTLYDAGLRSIQIDDPALTFFLTDQFRSGCQADGDDPDELLDLYIWAHNLCLEGRPSDLHVGIHLCRGNMAGSTHIVSGSYEPIAKRLFAGLNYDTLYLEYDTGRAGDFQPLRYLPVGRSVVLGVVSTKTPELEDLDELVDRVHAAADVIAQGQGRSREEVIQSSLGVSPQCGFSSMSVAGGQGVTEERMWEKMKLVQELAERIWGRI